MHNARRVRLVLLRISVRGVFSFLFMFVLNCVSGTFDVDFFQVHKAKEQCAPKVSQHINATPSCHLAHLAKHTDYMLQRTIGSIGISCKFTSHARRLGAKQ